jgi:hypothetical protein
MGALATTSSTSTPLKDYGLHGTVDVSYAALQAHRIVIAALHWEYSLGIVFVESQRRKQHYHV